MWVHRIWWCLLGFAQFILAPPWGNARIIVLASLGVAGSQLLLALIPHWVAAGMEYMGMVMLTYVVRPAVMVLH